MKIVHNLTLFEGRKIPFRRTSPEDEGRGGAGQGDFNKDLIRHGITARSLT